MDMKNITVGASPLTGKLYIYRMGAEEHIALDKREAEPEIITAFVDHMMHDSPGGAIKEVQIGDTWYEVSARQLEAKLDER